MTPERLYQPQRHIPALDGVRGIAILAVIGIHMMYLAVIAPPPGYNSFIHIFQFGWMGVDLFFVLSGFLITGILLDTCEAGNYFRAFYARRVLRIFPLYYGVLAALLALSPWLLHTRMHNAVPDRPYWLVYAFYLQSWWQAFHIHTNAGAVADFWSLGVEEQFYMVWPLLVFLLSRRNFTRLCLLLCIACPLLRWYLVAHSPNLPSELVFTSTATRMDTLVWGALAAIAVRSPSVLDRLRPHLLKTLLCSGVVILVIAFGAHEFYTRGFWTQTVGYTANAVCFTAFLLLAYISDSTRGRLAHWLDLRLLRSYGRYSYAIYVLHSFILLGLATYLKPQPWWGRSLPVGLLIFALFFVACWVVGYLSFFLFERHFLHLKKYFRADRRDAATLPQAASSFKGA